MHIFNIYIHICIYIYTYVYLVKQKYTKEARVCKAVKKSRVRMPVEDVEKEIFTPRGAPQKNRQGNIIHLEGPN